MTAQEREREREGEREGEGGRERSIISHLIKERQRLNEHNTIDFYLVSHDEAFYVVRASKI